MLPTSSVGRMSACRERIDKASVSASTGSCATRKSSVRLQVEIATASWTAS
jgi:hypothetical protein